MINLLLPDEKLEIRKEYQLRAAAVFLSMLFFALIIFLVSFSPAYFTVSTKYDALNSVKNKSQKTKNKDAASLIKETNEKIVILSDTKTETHSWNVVSQILGILPPQVAITGITYENMASSALSGKKVLVVSRVALSGNAATRESLLSFVDMLKKKSYFSGVELPISSLINETNLSFTIKMNVSSEAGIP